MEGERLARLEERVKDISEDVHEIKRDVRTLLEGHWKLFTGVAIVAFIVTLVTDAVARGVR